jgi:hypothetical protein
VTSFEVEVQLTLTENKWASNEHPSLNEIPEKKTAKKAICQHSVYQLEKAVEVVLTDPFELLYSGPACSVELETVSEDTSCEVIEPGEKEQTNKKHLPGCYVE